jgi:hypothetical protein
MPVTITLTDFTQRPGTLVPGTTLHLHITWDLDKPPKSIEAHLVYRTSGKGSQDAVSVASEIFPTPTLQGEWDVTLTLPHDVPPSYDGRLLSISWFAQATAGIKEMADIPLMVSFSGRPLVPQRTEK